MKRLLAILMFALLVGMSAPGPAIAQEATPAASPTGEITIFAPDETVYGSSRGEWMGRWWQWATSFPEADNPSFDPTGERCGYGQTGPVFYLPGSFVPDESAVITCQVPAGMAIYLPVAGSECSTVEPPPYFGRTEEEMRACAIASTDEIDAASLSVTINGQEVPDLASHRVTSPLFSFNFAPDNIFGAPAGVAYSVADGYDLILEPLTAGEYAISAAATLIDGSVLTAANYRIIVQEAQIIEPEEATPEAAPEA